MSSPGAAPVNNMAAARLQLKLRVRNGTFGGNDLHRGANKIASNEHNAKFNDYVQGLQLAPVMPCFSEMKTMGSGRASLTSWPTTGGAQHIPYGR